MSSFERFPVVLLTCIKKANWSFLVVVLTHGLIYGCAMHAPKPIRLYDPQSQGPDTVGVIVQGEVEWFAPQSESIFHRIFRILSARQELASVSKVDEVYIEPGNDAYTPYIIELSSGLHTVEVIHWSGHYGYGPLAKENVGTVELPVEAGHSYEPHGWNGCGRKWIWFTRQETSAQDALNCAMRNCLRRTTDKGPVVAGESPLATCASSS